VEQQRRRSAAWNERLMGCAGSKGDVQAAPVRDEAADVASAALEAQLAEENATENAIVKLLVLGTGESGKSTVFKQMKILYSVPDPPSKFIAICRANLFGNAVAVMDGMKRLNIAWGSKEAEEAGEHIKTAPPDGNPDNIASFVPSFKLMKEDPGVIEAIDRANEYQLNDSTIYFWERAEELTKSDYLPTEQDVLRARVRTTGIVQQNFSITGKQYTMFDVGGQRNERRKWIHCFDNVTAVIFVTAISEYDQVLYEDENTNRMDEALVLFDQICNHASFKKTSMILFLNKRDLMEMKLKKKDMTCWEDTPEVREAGQDYDKCVSLLKKRFIAKNKDQTSRQVYVHATCATDTNNIAFVMESVFDIILKENLRKLAKADLSKIVDMAGGTGISTVKTTDVWSPDKNGKIILACAWYVEDLGTRSVGVMEGNSLLPAVMLKKGLAVEDTDWQWVMGLGKDMPVIPIIDNEKGSFKGSLKEGAEEMRKIMGSNDLGTIYDLKIQMKDKSGAPFIVILVVKKMKAEVAVPGLKYVAHEDFENAMYKACDGKDTDADPCMPPKKGEEFNPFAANPVHHRWFKGVTLYIKEVLKVPDKGVYLGIFKVCSTTDGFKIMVNEHARIMIPMIFLTESQLTPEESKWMHGVRIREDQFKIDLLEGKQPNRGWLGPEMSGEEGATFPEKLWWAIDEAKARLDTESLGFQYDRELLFIDENNNIQLLLFGMLAKDETDVLPGHIWVSRDELEVQNMKYYCPVVLQAMLKETQSKVNQYQRLASEDVKDMDEMKKNRESKNAVKEEIEKLFESQQPLKWVNRVIMWCADKMPSFGKGIDGADANAVVELAMAANAEVDATNEQRDAIILKYKSA